MKLTIDFETRSACDLKKAGQWRYAEHPTTDVLCLAIKVDDKPARIWIPEKFRVYDLGLKGCELTDLDVVKLILSADEIEAHNTEFELAIWHHIMHKRYGFPDLPMEKMRDSMAKCAMHDLPMGLDQAGEVLNLPIKKDREGHLLMMKMCKPRKPLTAEKKLDPDWESKLWWHEKPEDIKRLCEYCMKDVEAEACLSNHLRDLSPYEWKVWQMSIEINRRGVLADTQSAKNVVTCIERYTEKLLEEFKKLTGGKVSSPKQVKATVDYLKTKGCHMTGLTKQQVSATLKDDKISAEARRLLEIRETLAKSSTAKYTALLDRAGADSRIRGLFVYHGAGTGRWAGRGLQPQNLPRGTFKDVIGAIELFNRLDLDGIEVLYGDLMQAASTCVRPMLVAPEGKTFMCADFSSIEGRVLAWLADEDFILKGYVDGLDMYKIAASTTFGLKYDEIKKSSVERQIGKVEELALGYGGGIGAFATMAKGYGLDLSSIPPLILPSATDQELETSGRLSKMFLSKQDENEEPMPPEVAMACDIIKQRWRANRPATTKFWREVQSAAMQAVSEPGSTTSYRNIKFGVRGNFLLCRLPSGRNLFYYKPSISKQKTDWGENDSLSYWGTDAETHKWTKIHTYGGKLTENIVQAVARDMLVAGMFNVQGAEYPIVLHVHDEAVSEVDEGFGSVEDYEKLISNMPEWANGCPVTAEGWCGKRYKKD